MRERSQAVFRTIKPVCVDLLLVSADPSLNDATLEHLLRTLATTLEQLRNESDSTDYVISTNLADYIFVPLSNLLRRQSLLDDVTRHILFILAYLLNYSWSYKLDDNLFDQLGPLIVFLSGGTSVTSKSKSAAEGKLLEFVQTAARTVEAFLNCIPRDYYEEQGKALLKRLSVLGDSTTLLLEFLQVLDATNEDVAQLLLGTLTRVYSTKVSSEQASFVFPGLVSKLISFYLQTKNLHSPTVISIIDLLRELIVKVFADNTLDLEKKTELLDIRDSDVIQSLFEADDDIRETHPFPVQFHISDSPGVHRTQSWLRATSKQLKLGLLTFVKASLLGPRSKTRLVSNTKLANSFIHLVSDVINKCFKSLYLELIFTTVDLLSALYHAATDNGALEDPLLLSNILRTYSFMNRSELILFFDPLLQKTENFINTQLQQSLTFANEDKLAFSLSAVYVHIHLCQDILINLMKPPLVVRRLKVLSLQSISLSLHQNVSQASQKKQISPTSQLLHQTTQGPGQEEQNTLDNIILPPEIDAKKVAPYKENRNAKAPSLYLSGLQRISFDIDSVDKDTTSFSNILKLYSKSVERQLERFLGFFGKSSSPSDLEAFVSALAEFETNYDESESQKLLRRCTSLWVSNNIYKKAPLTDQADFNINDFLDFGNEDTASQNTNEADFIALDATKELLLKIQTIFEERDIYSDQNILKVCEVLQSVALESLGLLASRFNKEQFQTDVLMDYLYPLFECFAQSPEDLTHLQAKLALTRIAEAHYDGSLEKLILDNADYLIDSLSIKFSVSSGLTPALSGILLVVLKISGVQLLESNQLQDVIAEIFIIIDSYHGYSALVENFFVVFQEVIVKTKELYKVQLSVCNHLPSSVNSSAYKPWGLESIEQMLELIKDNENVIEPPIDFDSNKEYFRKPNLPFSEQMGDSDDEDNEDEGEGDMETENVQEENKWESFVSENIYHLIEQIFKYGCQMLNHPSTKLKNQVLITLKEAYPLLSTNYKTLMPLIADYFPSLLVLCTGSSTLSDYYNDQEEPQSLVHLIVPALELLELIIVEDSKHEKFLSSRFLEIWSFFKQRSPILAGIVENPGKSSQKQNKARELTSNRVSKRIKELYSTIFLVGLRTYERTVPDLLAHEIVRVCSVLGFDETLDLGKDVQNHLWVLQNC